VLQLRKLRMAKGLIKLQEEFHHRLLKLRSIEAMIRRPQFERLWGDSDECDKVQLQQYLFEANKDGVIRWMKDHPSLQLEEKPLVDLKKIAYKLGISNYSRKGKLQLVRDIKEKEDKYGTHQGLHA
jgi:hypothetical protein